MIPYRFIQEWRERAPWQEDAMVEQDLMICRVLIEIFNHPKLASSLAFRGGTALHKLFLKPQARYSEDIDLVQTKAEPIGETFDEIRKILDPLLGIPRRALKEGRANLYYRYPLENNPNINMRLKIEINTREHFSVLNYQSILFSIENSWFNGSANINTFNFNELISTKLRALYQRNKGRDLFDLWLSTQHDHFDLKTLLHCFNAYMQFENKKISRAEFEENLLYKMNNPVFINDMNPLISKALQWNAKSAFYDVYSKIIYHIPGEPWSGCTDQFIQLQDVKI